MEYLGRWQFWVAVVIVSFITHWLMTKFTAMGSVGATS